MQKSIPILSFLLLFSLLSTAQSTTEKILFIIDSVPIITNPEDWNSVSGDEIADSHIIRDKDSLRQLGWAQVDGITYLFTKAFRSRTDSLNRIPGLLRMEQKNGAWYFHDTVYSGPYIDYYNNGDIQTKGTMTGGKINGVVTVYYKSGAVRSVSEYWNGAPDGTEKRYYKNGRLMEEVTSEGGRYMTDLKFYFINGQAETERRQKKKTPYDTLVTYYSTGNIKKLYVVKSKDQVRSQKDEDIAYYATKFLQTENVGNTKEMGKNLIHLLALDSNSTDTYFKEGMLLAMESHFDKAVADFDKVLQLEPLDREALLQRGLTRLKKQHFKNRNAGSSSDDASPTLADFTSLPVKEQLLVCADFRLAEQVDASDFIVKRRIPAGVFDSCSPARK